MAVEANELDPYAVLGLEPGATRAEVEAAWRRALKATHPDRNPDAGRDDRRLLEVLRAGRILRDPDRRAAWDRAHGAANRPPARPPTWTGLAWDGGAPQREAEDTPGRIDVVHRKG